MRRKTKENKLVFSHKCELKSHYRINVYLENSTQKESSKLNQTILRIFHFNANDGYV
jgi:hypothetical protein